MAVAGGYNDPPADIGEKAKVGTADGRIAACTGQTPAPIAWINLDETSEIGVNQMFAGIVPKLDPAGKNTAPQRIRYAVKTRRIEYDYVVASTGIKARR